MCQSHEKETWKNYYNNLNRGGGGCHPAPQPCPQLPGTILRIFIPAGAVINLLNLIEFSSPSGICLIIRSPLLGGLLSGSSGSHDFSTLVDSIRNCGGSVEVLNQ